MPMLLHANKTKMRYSLGIVCAAFFASSAAAQLTTVSGTITDPGSIPYANGQIKMQLVLAGGAVSGQPTVTVSNQAQCVSGGFGSAPCKIPFQGTVGPLALSPTGSFTTNLQDNTLVTPAGTQWLFTVTLSPGELPPVGFGPQTCSATVTITGAAQTVSSSFACPALARTSNGLGVFQYNPNDTTVCAAGVTTGAPGCPDFGAIVDSALFDQATDRSSFVEMLSYSDTSATLQNQFIINAEGESHTAVEEAALIIATNSAPSTAVSPGPPTKNSSTECFQGSATSCAVGVAIAFGDNRLTTNNGQDGAGVVSQPILAKAAGNMNQSAAYTVYPPNCFFNCSITETVNNLYGFDVQDLQGRGTALTAGFHVRAQTNPTSTTHNFAIEIDSGGGTSSFDGVATTINCQLGGAAGTTSPAACTSATAGMIAIPASQTTYTVNTSKVTANSEIFVQQMTDNSGLPSAPTCNAGATTPIQSARVAGTSFTFTLTSVAAVTCVKFWIVN